MAEFRYLDEADPWAPASNSSMMESPSDTLRRMASLGYDVSEGVPGSIPLMTNIPDAAIQAQEKGTSTILLKPTEAPKIIPKTEEDPVRQSYDNLRVMMEDIAADKDEMSKMKKINDLQAGFGALYADEMKKVRGSVETLYGAPVLRNSLAAATQEDEMNVRFGLQPSMKGQVLREKVAQMEASIDQHTRRAMLENADLNRLGKQIEGFIALQSRAMDKNAAAAAKAEAKADEALSIVRGIPPDMREAINRMNPNYKDDKILADNISDALKDTKGRATWFPVIRGEVTLNDMLPQAMGDNTLAKNLALHEQAYRTGLPKEKVSQILGSVEKFMLDDEFAVSMLPLKEQQAFKKSAQEALLSTDKAKEHLKTKLGMIDRVAGQQLMAALMSDIESWPKVDSGQLLIDQVQGAPEVIKMLKTANPGKPVDLNSFMAAFIGNANITPEEKIARSNEIQSLYLATLNEIKKNAIWGQSGIDTLAAGLQFKSKAVASGIKRPLSEEVPATLSTMADLFTGRPVELKYGRQ